MKDPNAEELFDGFVREMKQLPFKPAPPGLAGDVIRSVRLEAGFIKRAAVLSWRPALAMAAALLIFLGALMLYRPRPDRQSPAMLQAVKFEVSFEAAVSVALVGDFNHWDRSSHPLTQSPDGKWDIEVSLEPGAYQYQFLVDGKLWKPDPQNPIAIDDGFGGVNSGIEL